MILDTLGYLNSPQWMESAACRLSDPDMFYSTADSGRFQVREVQEATSVCAICPVRMACLSWAMQNKDSHGILGGLTPQQRARLRKRMAA